MAPMTNDTRAKLCALHPQTPESLPPLSAHRAPGVLVLNQLGWCSSRHLASMTVSTRSDLLAVSSAQRCLVDGAADGACESHARRAGSSGGAAT